MVDAQEFYDGLAQDYDVLFEDWWKAAEWHGSVVAEVLASRGVSPPARILDCTCGIGTQALPLASCGYAVTGTDISSRAVARARAEASARGLDVPLSTADVRDVRASVAGVFDAAISCDNALPHLLTDADLGAALRSVRACLREGGLLLASLRDYDSLVTERPAGVPITLYGVAGRRRGAGQSWRWSRGADVVDITLFTLAEADDGWQVSAHETRYRALQRATLTAALLAGGFTDVEWVMPGESGYYQPIVLATAGDQAHERAGGEPR
ncbi:MAG: class I SAM-dependent methyltransferase [Mycobacteriales bacterium]